MTQQINTIKPFLKTSLKAPAWLGRIGLWCVKFDRNHSELCWLMGLAMVSFGLNGRAQSLNVVDRFNPSGIGVNNYAGGAITNVWKNWFGGAFQSLAWDAAGDASGNASSGSMEITASFDGAFR